MLHDIHMLSAIIYQCLKFNLLILASLLISGRWPGLGGGNYRCQFKELKSPEPDCCNKRLCSIEDWGIFHNAGFGRYKKSRS